MKFNFKSVCLGFIAGAVVVGTVPAMAKSGADYINVVWRDIKNVVDFLYKEGFIYYDEWKLDKKYGKKY